MWVYIKVYVADDDDDDNVKITFVHTFGDNNINYKENVVAASRAAACPHSAVTNVQFFDSSRTGESLSFRILIRKNENEFFDICNYIVTT